MAECRRKLALNSMPQIRQKKEKRKNPKITKNFINNMSTVAETELEQKIGEFIMFVRDYAANHKGDFKVISKRDKAMIMCIDNDVTLDFSI